MHNSEDYALNFDVPDRLCATASDTAASRQQDVGSGGATYYGLSYIMPQSRMAPADCVLSKVHNCVCRLARTFQGDIQGGGHLQFVGRRCAQTHHRLTSFLHLSHVYDPCDQLMTVSACVADAQIWLEMAAPPTEDDVDLLDTVITSWFMIGRLGGYNSMNLQVRA